MGQEAENLLDDILETGASSRLVDPSLEEHIVIGEDRYITVPPMLKKVAVQFDHNIETVTFDCPRYWDGHDMSQMKVYINYLTPNNSRGMYPAENVIVDATDDTIMHFDWTISREVTSHKGTISFLVCVKAIDDNGNEKNHWNSELNREMVISEGLECEESIVQEYPDLITQILLRLDRIGVELTFEDDGNGNVTIEGMSNLNNLCPKFSKDRQYTAGEYCMYLGALYKSITDIEPGEEWDENDWIETYVTKELTQCFQDVDDGKTLIASAITDMAVPTGANDTFQQMADNIRSIKTGVAADGTAEVTDVTAGKTFINSTGVLLTGTSTAASDLVTLRAQYVELSDAKDTLQGEYDELTEDYTELQTENERLVGVQTSYDEYKNAVVNGLANSNLGVTEETTAEELEALLLLAFPDIMMVYSDGTLAEDAVINEFTNTDGNLFAMARIDKLDPSVTTETVNIKPTVHVDMSRYSKIEVTLRYYIYVFHGEVSLSYGIDATDMNSITMPNAPVDETHNTILTIDISSYTGVHSLGFDLNLVNGSSGYEAKAQLYISQIKLIA